MSFPPGCGDLIGAQFAAAEELGMRMFASRGSMDLSRKDGGLPPDSVVQTVDAIMKDSARVIEAYHDPSFGSMRQVALAPCSPFSVSGELLRQSAILARQYGVRLHTHLCETRDEEHYTLDALRRPATGVHGISGLDRPGRVVRPRHPFQRRGAAGAGPHRHRRGPLPHQQHEVGLRRGPGAGDAGAGRPGGIGGGRLRQQRRVVPDGGTAGVRICSTGCTASKAAPSGYQVLKMATRGSARLLGRDDIGQLAVGKCADLFLVDSRRLELVGGEYSPADVLATVGLRGPVDYTVVNGRVVVKEGHLVTIDEEKTAADARNACGAYLAKA